MPAASYDSFHPSLSLFVLRRGYGNKYGKSARQSTILAFVLITIIICAYDPPGNCYVSGANMVDFP